MTKGLHFQLLKFVLYMCSMLFLFCFPVNPHVGYKNQTMDNEVKHFCGCAVAERAVWTCSPPKVSSGRASDSARGAPGCLSVTCFMRRLRFSFQVSVSVLWESVSVGSSRLACLPLFFPPSGTFRAVQHSSERGDRRLVTLRHKAVLLCFGKALDCRLKQLELVEETFVDLLQLSVTAICFPLSQITELIIASSQCVGV